MNQQNGNHIGLIRGAEIPSRWEKLLNFVLFAERKDQNQDDLPLLSVTIERGVLLQAKLEDRKDISNPNKSKYKRVAPGDIVYNPMRMWQGAVGMSEHEGLVSPAYIVLKPIQDINPKFFHYLFRTPEYTTEAYRNSYGIVDDQHSLRYADFRRMESIVPPREEQDEIVEYLDQKTDHIDEYIVKKRELIDLLETLRRAVINRAVTQGLDDGVEMTDSGVEWLGEIPAHWEKTPLKRVSHLIQSGPFGSQLKANEYVEGQVPVINPSNLTDGRLSADQSRTVLAEKADELKRHQVEKGDILFARRGKLGACALVTNSEKGWLCGTGCARVILDKDSLHPKFALYYLSSEFIADWLEIESIGATMSNINSTMIGRIPVVLPSLDEQKQIIEHISNRTSEVDDAIDQAERQIGLMEQYRTSLVAEVVTGQVDVRDVAAA